MSAKSSMTTRKKLIEVALPLDAINAASAREKSIRHGHPSTLHLWWARRPAAELSEGGIKRNAPCGASGRRCYLRRGNVYTIAY